MHSWLDHLMVWMKQKLHLSFQDFIRSSLTVVYLLVGASMNIQIETVHGRDPAIHRPKHYFEAFRCGHNFSILCRKRAKTAVFALLCHCENICWKKKFWHQTSSFEEGLFFSSATWESLELLPPFIGHRVVLVQVQTGNPRPGLQLLHVVFLQCSVSPLHLVFSIFFATTKSPHQPTWSIKSIQQRQCCYLKRVEASS